MAASRRFGVFEVNLQARELRKHGTHVRLGGHAFEILALLLERPGEIVTREQLRTRLWHADTFVDFEHGLNSAIKKLRATLGDSPESPRYIETLPRLGYRFIAPVSTGDARRGEAEWQTKTPPFSELLPMHSSQTSVSSPSEHAHSRDTHEKRHRFLSLPNRVLLVFLATPALLGALYVARPIAAPPRVVRIRQITRLGTVEAHQNLVTDGPRIYFRDRTGGQRTLKYVSSAGGETNLLPNSSAEFDINGISPDGARLLVSGVAIVGDNPAWALPAAGGSPIRLGNIMYIDADWSPDGRQLAYMTAQNEVCIAHADGSGPQKLADVPGTPFCPRWSPDSKRLRFVVIPDKGPSELWEVAADGKRVARPLLPSWGKQEPEWGGSWSADGKYYFFSSTVQGVKCVWALREKTDWWHRVRWVPVQLTSGPISYSLLRSSRDGKTLFVIGEDHRAELLRYDPNLGKFVPYAGGTSADHVSFSSDSQWRVYVSYPDGALWRSKLDGTQKLQLSFPPLRALVPRWSPDGKWIAFAGVTEPGQRMKLYRVPANGLSLPEQLLPAERGESYPGWSPDGNQIVFGRAMRPDEPDTLDISVLDTQTRKVSEIPGSHGLFEPQWSPNGRYIIAISSERDQMMLFDFQTQKWTSLGVESAHYPTWSGDGEYIYYLEMPDNFSQEKAWDANRLRLSDHKMKRFCSLHGLNLTGVYGWWSGPAPDGSPLALNDASRRDIYAIDADLP